MKPKTTYKRVIQDIKCFFGFHDLNIVNTKSKRGIFFGGVCKANQWGCACGFVEPNWTMTESITALPSKTVLKGKRK